MRKKLNDAESPDCQFHSAETISPRPRFSASVANILGRIQWLTDRKKDGGIVRSRHASSMPVISFLIDAPKAPLSRGIDRATPIFNNTNSTGGAASHSRLQGAGSSERRWRTCTRQASYALEEIPESLLRVLSKHEVFGVSYGPQGTHLAQKSRQDHVGEQERATPDQGQRACRLLA